MNEISNNPRKHSSLTAIQTEQLQEELALFRSLVNQSNDAIFLIHLETSEILFMNEKAAANLGYDASGLKKLKVTDIAMNVRNQEQWQQHAQQVRKQGYALFETEQICKGGTRRPVEVNAKLLRHNGREYIVSIARDLSERRQSQMAIIEEKNKLAAVLAAIGDGVTVQDTNFKILYQNDQHKEKQGDHIGEYCYQAYQNNDQICSGCLLVKCFEDGMVHRRETTAQTPHGPLHLEVSASPIKDAEGRIVAGIESVRDVTTRRQLEAQLQQAQKMEAIGTLAGGIAHDFNNILFAILGFTELSMLQVTEGSELHANLQEIRKASGRATDLIRQILTFSRKKNVLEKTSVDIQAVVQEVVNFLRQTIPAAIEIYFQADPACPPVFADATQLHQVIMNLCTNAYHAMRDTGGRLELGLSSTGAPPASSQCPEVETSRYVLLTISDTGRGMDRTTLKRIFEPYFTTKEAGEGTGLGLATVHGIVKNHGGTITAESSPGEGSLFKIYFPALEQQPCIPAATTEEIPQSSAPRHIMLVDDEQPIRRLGKSCLERLRYRVSTFDDPRKALEAFASAPADYDAVITDQNMPGLTGAELAEKLLCIRKDLPIILVTGYSEKLSETQRRKLGIAKYLPKPISLLELGQAVSELLQNP